MVGGEVEVRAEAARVLIGNGGGDGGNPSDRLPVPAVFPFPIDRWSVFKQAISVTQFPVAAVITGEIGVGAVAETAVVGEEIRVSEEEAAVITPPPPLSAVLSPPPVRWVLPPPPSMKLPVHDRAISSLSSTTTEFVVSSNGPFKKQIRSWVRGHHLGSGSFGTVYKALIDDGTVIAVKEVSLIDKGSNAQQCILQLEQEIALLSQFEHENIVQYYGTAKEKSKLFIFLELVTQGSLVSLYKEYRLHDTQVSSYTRQILNGLNYLHECGVVHRDIKCANILVHANASIKLADFGVAKQISELDDLKSCHGSPYWMAPEVFNPNKTYGRPADIWSLGCTVLEMLTGQIPYPGCEPQHALFRILRGEEPPIPSHLSSDAQDFIRKCVQVEPSTRPSAAQLLEHPFVMK